MFSKLLKYEWKANAGLLGILSLCALGAGLLGGGVLRALLYMTEKAQQNSAAVLGITGLSSLLAFIALALVAYGLGVEFILLLRFYKSRFTDEGYLTFTLPVKTEEIFLSSYAVALLWSLIAAAVIAASVGLAAVLGAGDRLGEIFQDISGDYVCVIEGQPGYRCFTALSVLQTVVSVFYSLMMLMTGITMGCVLAKKHKLLASVGLCYGLHMAVGVADSILTMVPALLMNFGAEQNYYIYSSFTLAISILLQLALTIGGYLLSVHLMQKKLNLP